MTTITKTVTSKVSMTAEGLEAALNNALQTHPECEGIRVLKLIGVKQALQKHFNLVGAD